MNTTDDEDDPALDRRIVEARPEFDDTVRAVVRANALRTLFGATNVVKIGRYELARELGTGGGGSVFLARDPELQREVALKVIATPGSALRERALAEGQALARLAHPNVVAVFDVGAVDDRVYLVMELVRGESLRALANRAGTRDVLRAYRQAGEGLVAAHDAGLVHRDFKPDNAVIADDGRVRLVDFGLAGALGDEARGGTAGYVAPEVSAGGAATPAIDQYAFAVSLGEGIARAHGGALPRWLEPIVRRGSSPDPAARFPSMRDLLRALARDPRTRWTRRAVVATPLVLAAFGFLAGRTGDDAAPAPTCDDGAAVLAPAWTLARAAAAHDHVRALGTTFAAVSAPRVRTQLAEYASSWIKSRNAACVAARTEPSTVVVERRSTCLASAKNHLASTVEMFATIDANGLGDAMLALSELPALDRCADPEALRSDVAPPQPAQRARVAEIREAIDRTQALVDAARPEAVPAAVKAVADARALGYRPLLATALLLQGRASLAVEKRAESIAPLDEATELAILERDDRVAVESFARAMLAKMSGSQPAQILSELRPIAVLARRLSRRDRFAAALLYNHAGVLQLANGHPELARALQTAALALARDMAGPGSVELAWVRSNLALVTDDDSARKQLNSEAVAIARARLGDEHPMTLKLAISAGLGRSDRVAARTAAHAAFTRFVELHGEQHAAVVDYGYELAILDLGAGDRISARAMFTRIVAATDVSRTERYLAASAYLQLLDGRLAAARASFDGLVRQPGTTTRWYALFMQADIEVGRALAGAHDGAVPRAIGYLERASAAKSMLVGHRLAWARSLKER